MVAGSKWAAQPEVEHSPGLPTAQQSDLKSPAGKEKYPILQQDGEEKKSLNIFMQERIYIKFKSQHFMQ